MKELSLFEQHQQYLSGIGEAVENPRKLQARLKPVLVKAMNTRDLKIVKLFKSHCVCAVRDDGGRNVFYRVSFVVGDYPLITLGDIQAVKDDEEDKVASALGAVSIEHKIRQRRLAGLFETKDLGIPGIGNGSFEDLRSALGDALKSRFGNSYVYAVATYPDKVIVRVTTDGEVTNTYYEILYKIKSGQIELGDSMKVQKKVSYQKAEARIGMSLDEKRRQQRLAGVNGEEHSDLRQGKSELREAMFDRGGVTILNPEVLLEGKIRNPMVIQGIAGKVGVTGNRRYYSKDFWQKVVEKSQDKVKSSRFLAELDHPTPEGSHGRLSQTGAKHTKVFMDGDYVKFEAEVLDTQAGQTLKNLLRGGVSVGASTRIFADTKKGKIDGRDVEIVEEDGAEFVGIDLVSEPAVEGAGVQSFR